MSSSRPGKSVSRIKTGSFERRLSLTRAGLFAGTRMASHMATNWFSNKETREQRHRAMLSSQARFLVDELGRLKGSVVKIGQVMALYGEHFLPEEVTEALHTLEDQTTSLEWPAIERVLKAELGESRLSELDIDPEPIGAASLGQVHRAVRRSDGLELVLKVQYPGVADAVDSDLNAVAHLAQSGAAGQLRPEFNDWLEEVREMMHREVDYRLEARTTEKFRQMLSHDARFVVPRVLPEYSTDHIIASTYEHGHSVSSVAVRELPLERRSALGQAALELFSGNYLNGVRSRPTRISATTGFVLRANRVVIRKRTGLSCWILAPCRVTRLTSAAGHPDDQGFLRGGPGAGC